MWSPVSLHPVRKPAGAPWAAVCNLWVTSTAILADLTASKRVFCSGLLAARLLPSSLGSLLRGRFETWRKGTWWRFGAAPGWGTPPEGEGRTYGAAALCLAGSPLAAQPQCVLEVAARVTAAEVPVGTVVVGYSQGLAGPPSPSPLPLLPPPPLTGCRGLVAMAWRCSMPRLSLAQGWSRCPARQRNQSWRRCPGHGPSAAGAWCRQGLGDGGRQVGSEGPGRHGHPLAPDTSGPGRGPSTHKHPLPGAAEEGDEDPGPALGGDTEGGHKAPTAAGHIGG